MVKTNIKSMKRNQNLYPKSSKDIVLNKRMARLSNMITMKELGQRRKLMNSKMMDGV